MLCLGEGLAVLYPEAPGGSWDRLRAAVGGAEANVAGGLAGLGVQAVWVSRLGQDPFGDLVERDLRDRGVRVLAERDPVRPTGAYLKERVGGGSRMHYYRAGSAASAMTGALLRAPEVDRALRTCELVHTSGITAGILDDDSDLVSALVAARDAHGFRLSVDLNWRPALWARRDRDRLLELLRVADVLLLGADEAEVVLGTSDRQRLRDHVGQRPRLVIKSDAHAVIEVEPDGTATRVPALRVEVVEPVGAGDGFAAGYLAGLLEGYDAVGRLRLGHLVAAGVLAAPGDHAHPPAADVRRTLLAADDDDWASTSVSARGISSPVLERLGEAR